MAIILEEVASALKRRLVVTAKESGGNRQREHSPPLCGEGICIAVLAAMWSPFCRPDYMLTALPVFSQSILTNTS